MTPSVSGEAYRALQSENRELRRTVATQARLLSLLAPETHPASPSLNCIYWLYAPTRWHLPSWRHEWNRLRPTLDSLGDVLAPDVTPVLWERHRARRRMDDQRGGGTPCEHTLNIELGRAKGLLDWATETGMIKFNPLTPARYVRTSSRRETKLRQWDVEGMLAAAEKLTDRRLCEGDDDGRRAAQLRAFVLLCFDEMLRFNEARRIRRDMIEPNGDYTLRAEETKGRRARTVTLTPRTLEAIAAVPRHPDTHAVFVNPETGGLLGQTTMRGWFRWACQVGKLDARAAPGERIVPHHLRHAGATAADEAGARPGALQETLGHASLKTTERYLHRDKAQSARHVAEAMILASDRRPPKKAARRT